MTRGLYPPDTLSKDDIYTLHQLRKDLWYNAMIGGGFGAGSGLVFHTSVQWAHRRFGIMTKTKFNRNTLMLSVLGGGALGMFLFAVSTGKEQVHTLHPIFQIGASPPGELDRHDYQSKMRMTTNNNNNMTGGDSLLDMERMQQTRVTRRRTMTDSFRRTGLSDSHGGHWYKEEEVHGDPVHNINNNRND